MKIASVIFALAVLAIAQADAAASPHRTHHKPVYGGGRIVGGTLVPAHGAPWQAEIYSTATYDADDFAHDKMLVSQHSAKAAYLEARGSFDYHHVCGGTLIAPNWVLTAAHCMNGWPPAYFLANRRIRLGTLDLQNGGSTYAIQKIVIKDDFDDAHSANDIALIEITPAAPIVPGNLATIRMLGSQPGDPLAFNAASIFRATGWGVTEARGAHDKEHLDDKGNVVHDSARLQQVNLNYVPPGVCAATAFNSGKITPGIVCAGVMAGGKDTCQGDSGGPLTFDISNGETSETVLVGIVSGGSGCALPKTPGLYTFVPPYLPWIAQVMASNQDQP